MNIFQAAKKCNVSLKYLIDIGCVNVNVTNKYNQTPLHIACKYNQVGNVKILLKNNANMFIIDKYGKYPIHYITDSKRALK